MRSYNGLTEYQASGRKFILERNLLLVHFMLNYGLSIQDIITLSMHDINFGTNTITPGGLHAYNRSITLSRGRKTCPILLQSDSKAHTATSTNRDPFFVAFDLGWILLSSEVPYQAAKEGFFPSFFTKTNKKEVQFTHYD